MIIHKDLDLSKILFYKIGGTAKSVLEVKSPAEILDAFNFIKEKQIKKSLVIGLGANLVMNDDYFDGAIIWVNKNDPPEITEIDNRLLKVYAGQTIDDVIQYAFNHSYKGIEAMGGLPSSVGGAVRGNAGAFGVEMKDVIEKIEVYDIENQETKELSNAECEFSYRDSMIKQNPNLIILNAYFKLQKTTEEEIIDAKKIYYEQIEYRKKNHPIEYPSCGSVFKNIKKKEDIEKIIQTWPDIETLINDKWHGKASMGYIIKRLGFQGMQVGGAKITEKHANYISNINNAKYEDVVSIIDQIIRKFEYTFEFRPELEVEIVKI